MRIPRSSTTRSDATAHCESAIDEIAADSTGAIGAEQGERTPIRERSVGGGSSGLRAGHAASARRVNSRGPRAAAARFRARAQQPEIGRAFDGPVA